MERDKPSTVLTDEELAKVSGGSNPLIAAFTQGFQTGFQQGLEEDAGGIKALNDFQGVLNKAGAQ